MAALGMSAASPGPQTKVTPDISNLRYQARNHKTMFDSERSLQISDLNARIDARNHQPVSRAASLTPDFSIPASDQYEYIDGPGGAVYFCSAEFETEDFVINEYYTRRDITAYNFTVYDHNLNVVGTIRGKVQLDSVSNPDNPEIRVASMGMTPIITRRFFNSDDKLEALVYFNFNTPDNSVISRSLAFQLGGAKDEDGYDKPICAISGNLCDVLEAPADKWSEDFYLSFVSDYQFPIEEGDESFGAYVNSLGALIETYKKAPYGSTQPVKFFEYKMRINDWPGDQESATPFLSRAIDGKPYFIINGYTDGLWEFDEIGEYGYPDQTWNPDTKFFVDIYQPTSLDNPNLLQHTEIDMELSEGDNVFATFYYLGNLAYTDDVNFDYCDEPGKANLVITTKDWTGAEMGTTSTYYLYAPNGQTIALLGKDVDGSLALSDVSGQEPEYMFVHYSDGEYTFDFLNPFNANHHHSFGQTLPYNGKWESLYVNADRVAFGNSYRYCFELGAIGLDADGNDIMRLAWIDPDGQITGIEEVNMGRDVHLAKVYLSQETLNPYLFDTTPEREYMIILKRGIDGSSSIREEFIISSAISEANPKGKILLEITPDETRGNLIQVATLDVETNPKLWVMFYENVSSKYWQEFYRLPFSKFAGGDGSPENPYQIATIGDLQCVRDNLSACYELVADLDGDGVILSPIGSSTMPFTGIVKGNGHTISNLTIGGGDYQNALFSYIDNAAISDITFINPTVNIGDATYNALLVAQAQRSTISNIHAVGLSAKSDRAVEFGSIVNRASLNTSLTSCYVANADINLPAASVVGGIAADTRTGSSISTSAFTGSIVARSTVGGILGTSGANSGSVTDCHVDADIEADNIVGGIVGDMDQRITVDRCYVEGSLTASKTFGTRIVNKGYAVGGIAGAISQLYQNNNPEGEGSEAGRNDVVTNCVVNLSAITVPELPEGHQKSVHRIAGFTSINNLEPDWDNITDTDNIDKFLPTEPELGLKNNYAVASLAIVDCDIESGAATTEGCTVDALDGDLFASLGYKYGSTAENPWSEVPDDDPSLYFEFGAKFLADEITAVVGVPFDASLLVISRHALTDEEFIDGFACEISDESVAQINGSLSVDRNIATIGFDALREGTADFTANVNGSLAKFRINVVGENAGIADAVMDDSIVISVDGTTISAPGASVALYTTDGRRVAAGRDNISVAALPAGVYIVTAVTADGSRATRKLILQ